MLNADVDVAAGELFLNVDDFGDHLNDRVASLPLHIQILPQQRDIDLRLRRVLASLKDLLSNRHRFGNQLPCKMAGIGLPASSSMMP